MKNVNIAEFKTLADFLEYFKDEETCREHFTAIRFRNGEYCPHCGATKIYTFSNGKRYRCGGCKQDFTIKTGTVFGESKLAIKKWFIAIYLLSTSSKGISSVQLAKQVGVTQKTGWFMDHRIRSAMKQNKGQLFGTVEADETYIGGSRKGRSGRGAHGKTPVIGILERGGKIVVKATADVSANSVVTNIAKNVKAGSTVMTDEFPSYRPLGKLGFNHQTICHKENKYVDGLTHTQGIESFWALFKRGYHGVYHFMSPKHLQKYIDESVFRFNRRPMEMKEIFAAVIAGTADNKQLPYKELIA